MNKLVDDNARNWHNKLYEALWADIITPKRAIGMAPYDLVYGIGAKVSLPLELAAARLQTVIEDSLQDALEKRVMNLMKLDEEREMLVDRITKHENKVEKILDMRARPRGFLKGDEVLLWDKRREPKGAHGKFDSLWKGENKKSSHTKHEPNPALNFSASRYTRSWSVPQKKMEQVKDT
ncbi:uncharacterized protein LOC131876157 [Cryptomeria japonica]|uniref:uncharacterized protein LOC131876157 n=1 Tax=Cryptomeria japonica TaxID=3369 RepID=UPI0027DA5660|nr:uncharacterized protein LOC131876157 [Cryptomeria japonica]